MRNLSEYPITLDEKIKAVEWAYAKAIENAAFGDIRPAAMADLLDELKMRRIAEGLMSTGD